MTIEVEREKPVADAEKAVVDAAPAAVQPEVKAIEAEFNKAVDSAAEKAPEAEAKAAEKEPAIEEAAQDVSKIAAGGTVVPGEIAHLAPALVKEVKAGYKTTEFWLTAAVIVLTQVGAFHLPGKYGDTITTAAAATAYILSRGLAK